MLFVNIITKDNLFMKKNLFFVIKSFVIIFSVFQLNKSSKRNEV